MNVCIASEIVHVLSATILFGSGLASRSAKGSSIAAATLLSLAVVSRPMAGKPFRAIGLREIATTMQVRVARKRYGLSCKSPSVVKM